MSPARRRLLLMCHDYPPHTGGGLAGAVNDLTEVLSPDFDVVVVASRAADHFADDRGRGPSRRPLATAVFAWRLARRADCVVVHWTFSFRWLSCLALILGPATGRPTLCVVHTAPGHLQFNRLRRTPGPVRRRLPRLAAIGSRRCAAVVALSPSHARSMRAAGFPPTHVLPAPVETEQYAAVFAAREDTDKAGGGRFDVVGVAGELSALKGTDALPGLLAVAVPEFALRIVGRGPLAPALQRAVGAMDPALRRRIHLSDRLEPAQMADFYSGVDAVLVCSRTEAQGRVAIEAMLAGAVVLARPVEGLVDVVDDGRTGFLIDPEDPRAVLERLRSLRNRPWLVRDVRRAARNRAEELMSLSAREWRRVLGHLLGADPPLDQSPVAG